MARYLKNRAKTARSSKLRQEYNDKQGNELNFLVKELEKQQLFEEFKKLKLSSKNSRKWLGKPVKFLKVWDPKLTKG